MTWSKGHVCVSKDQDRMCRWYKYDNEMSNLNYNVTKYDYKMTHLCEDLEEEI